MQFPQRDLRGGKAGGSGGGAFLNIIPSDPPIDGVLVGKPQEEWRHWIDGSKSYVECKNAGCKWCENGNRAKYSFKINFVIKQNGALVAKILRGDGFLYDQLSAMGAAGIDFSKTVVSISMTKRGNQKNWIVVQKAPLNQEAIKAIGSVSLRSLTYEPSSPKTEPWTEEKKDRKEWGADIPQSLPTTSEPDTQAIGEDDIPF